MSAALVTSSAADPVAAAAARPPRERLATLDAMRLAAAVAIIWLHTAESPQLSRLGLGDIGRFGVPFFGAAAVLLTSQSLYANPSRRWRQFTVGRAKRLLVPFVAWTVIY